MLARYAIPKLIGVLIVGGAMFVLLYRLGQPVDSPRSVAEQPVAWRTSLDGAFEEARNADRLVFVEWTADWCGPCQEMERGAFRDEVVVKLLNERFIPVRLDWDRRRDIASTYRVRMLPTMQVFTPDERETHRITAKRSPAELESFLRTMLGE